MNRQSIKTGKILLTVIWIGLTCTLFIPGEFTILTIARYAFWGMLAVHVIECGVFFGALRASGKPLAGQIIQVLLFGIAHYASLKLDAEEAVGESTPA